MEGHRTHADGKVDQKGEDDAGLRRVPQAVPDALDAQVDEDQVGERVDELSNVIRDIIILRQYVSRVIQAEEDEALNNTSSHQFRVEVCSPQKPSLASLYGI
jgi:hypothetical protein